MSRIQLMSSQCLLVALVVAVGAFTASAVPITGVYTDLPGCDDHGVVEFDEEIGDSATFPTDEAIFSSALKTINVICVGDDGIPNDWQVRIANLTTNKFKDLFFVADEGSTVGNRDGVIEDVVNAPGGRFDAFRIDNLGANQPLIGGDLNGDLIFDPGETWTFLVTNFGNSTLAAPAFLSPGVFAGSSTDPNSNASIVANLVPIPEPATGLLIVIGMTAIVSRRKFAI